MDNSKVRFTKSVFTKKTPIQDYSLCKDLAVGSEPIVSIRREEENASYKNKGNISIFGIRGYFNFGIIINNFLLAINGDYIYNIFLIKYSVFSHFLSYAYIVMNMPDKLKRIWSTIVLLSSLSNIVYWSNGEMHKAFTSQNPQRIEQVDSIPWKKRAEYELKSKQKAELKVKEYFDQEKFLKQSLWQGTDAIPDHELTKPYKEILESYRDEFNKFQKRLQEITKDYYSESLDEKLGVENPRYLSLIQHERILDLFEVFGVNKKNYKEFHFAEWRHGQYDSFLNKIRAVIENKLQNDEALKSLPWEENQSMISKIRLGFQALEFMSQADRDANTYYWELYKRVLNEWDKKRIGDILRTGVCRNP